ncbi:MAG: SRPBCC domain-containing protein [Melioribacteraceae bacterium]|nr:SRPBCC domain-containing protein [Melioribacteraceae bacterium]
MKKTDEPIAVVQEFNKSIGDVWNAVTNVDLMRQWFFDNIPAFEPVKGFKTQFNVASGERNFLHMWEITNVDIPGMIMYNWKYKGYPGDASVVFELSESNSLTILKVSMNIIEDFPEDIPEFRRESCIAGWKCFICENLKRFLDG